MNGNIIKVVNANEGDLIDLHTPDRKREILKIAIYSGEYAIVKHTQGDVYDFLYRPTDRKKWELLVLETRYGKIAWRRHISPYKIQEEK